MLKKAMTLVSEAHAGYKNLINTSTVYFTYLVDIVHSVNYTVYESLFSLISLEDNTKGDLVNSIKTKIYRRLCHTDIQLT